MKKTIILIIIILSGMVVACPSEEIFTQQIKKSLFNYLQNPESSRLTLYEVKDLLTVYLTKDIAVENCSNLFGNESSLSISTILSKSDTIRDDVIPRCSDGTFYGECSLTEPKFCYSGMLKYMCHGPDQIYGTSDDCGCPEYELCETDGSCRVLDINCYSDDDCGISTYVGTVYCQDNDVYQDYINFTCNYPGSASSHCSFQNQNMLIEVCTNSCSNGVCI